MQASDVDWGSVPDWIAGVGSVLAFGGFAAAFGWEIHKRRVDDKDADAERRDALKRYARLVLVRVYAGSDTQKRLRVLNASSGPIIDIEMTMWVAAESGAGSLREVPIDRCEPGATEIGPGSESDYWLWFTDENAIPGEQEFFPRIEFTDCNGNRWSRTDNQQPVPVLNSGGDS